jgi:hypothetical protein
MSHLPLPYVTPELHAEFFQIKYCLSEAISDRL